MTFLLFLASLWALFPLIFIIGIGVLIVSIVHKNHPTSYPIDPPGWYYIDGENRWWDGYRWTSIQRLDYHHTDKDRKYHEYTGDNYDKG